MTKTFYSNGKLLLTSEYLVLDGAEALALPCKQGQMLEVTPVNDGGMYWTSLNHDGSTWLDFYFSKEQITREPKAPTDEHQRLLQVLQVAHQMNPTILGAPGGFAVKTRLNFPKNWGLGSSSTLICNIASWFGIDPYKLLEKTFGGSGYDVACGLSNGPIIFERKVTPIITATNFKPNFTDKIHFVYLNKKQDSRKAIANYRARNRADIAKQVTYFTKLTQSIVTATELLPFMALLEEHEANLSAILGMETVQKSLFPDFDGIVKSLGGWGGDFILAASENDPTAYFHLKGYPTVIRYNDMVK